MEETTQANGTSKSSNTKRIIISLVVITMIGLGLWYALPHESSFCFTFKHDTQFGDKKMATSSNEGYFGPRGNSYYIPEVPALQTALKKEGFYIDETEATGGGVYLTSFFGPSTQTAVRDFQKKYGMPITGEVDNAMIDKLTALYGCPAADTATSTASIKENYSISTTTIQ